MRRSGYEEELCQPVGKENALRDDCLEPGAGGIHPLVPMKGGNNGRGKREERIERRCRL